MEMKATADVQEPISVGGGESPVSWDQLESVSNFRSEVAKNEAKEEIAAKREAEKELGVKSTKKDNAEESEEKPAKAEAKPDKTAKAKDKAEEAEAKAEAKRLKLKHAEQEYDLPLDVQVPVKIDGKIEQVSLQEALSRYSQQKHLDRIYGDYKKEKAAFDSERGRLKDMVGRVHDLLVNKKDLRGFIETVAEPLGLDPGKLYQETVSQMESKFEEAQSLSPEERKARALEEELAYYRRKQEDARTQQAEAKSRQELEAKVESVLQASGMEKADFVKSYDELVKLGFEPNAISAEQVGQYYKNMQTINFIAERLGSINPELSQNDAEVERLAKLAIQTQASREEIAAVIEQLHGESAEKKLTKKITKSQRKSSAENPMKNPGKDPMFFDEI